MKKLLAAACLLLMVSAAHAQTGSVKTQAALNTEIGTTGCALPTCLYPDAPSGAITAFGLRQGLLDLNATLFAGGGTAPVSGPATTTSGDFAVWNNATGTLLKDVVAGSGVLGALSTNTGGPGAFVIQGGVLGTPLSGVATNITGLPLTTGVTGLLALANGGTGAATFAASTFFGNPTTGAAALTAFTLASLTQETVLDATNDKIPIYDNTAAKIKWVNPGTIASSSSAGVSSIGGITGAVLLGTGLTTSSSTINTPWTVSGSNIANNNAGTVTAASVLFSAGDIINSVSGSVDNQAYQFAISAYASGILGINHSGSTNSVGAPTGFMYLGTPTNIGLTFGVNGLEQERVNNGSVWLNGYGLVADIRDQGVAVTCNGASSTGVAAAIAAAIANGFLRVNLPANCWYFPTYTTNGAWTNNPPCNGTPCNQPYIAGPIQIIGENNQTSVISVTRGNEATDHIYLGVNVRLQNVGVNDAFTYASSAPSTNVAKISPIEYYTNLGAINSFAAYPWEREVCSHSSTTAPAPGGGTVNVSDLPCYAVLNSGNGDGSYYATFTNQADGIRIQTVLNSGVTSDADLGMIIDNGVSDIHGSHHSGVYVNEWGTNTSNANGAFVAVRQANGAHLLDFTDTAGGASTSNEASMVYTHKTSGAFLFMQQTASTYTGNVIQIQGAGGSGTFSGDFLNFTNAGNNAITVGSSGNLIIGYSGLSHQGLITITDATGSCTVFPNGSGFQNFACSSDRRLKRDIVDSGDALAYVHSFEVRDYTLKSDGKRYTGVIAQEVQARHPEIVNQSDVFDPYCDCKPLLVGAPNPWKMVKAMQEMQTEIAALKNRMHMR